MLLAVMMELLYSRRPRYGPLGSEDDVQGPELDGDD